MGTSNVTLIQKSLSFVACNVSHFSNTVLEGYINELNDRVKIYMIRKKSFRGVILRIKFSYKIGCSLRLQTHSIK